MGIDYLTVGYHKHEMDFGVNCAVADLTYEEMKQLREMIVVGIGQLEQMWRSAQEKKCSPAQEVKVAP